jgi:phage terminase large subunit
MESNDLEQTWLGDAEVLARWARSIFYFAEDTMKMYPAEAVDSLKGVMIPYTDGLGNRSEAMLFDKYGNLAWHDLKFYTSDMFKNQSPEAFKAYKGSRFTWQQTIVLEAYNRAIRTFGKDSFDEARRWITTKSGHGIGKTGTMSVIALHFLFTYPGAQIGMTSNSEQQVSDIFMKEVGKWKMRLPQAMQDSITQTVDHIRVNGTEDWFLRAQVARPDKPEAIAGLHGEYILILVDEASGVNQKVFEVMRGAATGECYIFMYFSNPTQNEGEFYESHKPGAAFTQLSFSSRQSPIVKPGYIATMENRYPAISGIVSDEVLIRVDGEFAGVNSMDEKGWIPLFANVQIHFEKESMQIFNGAVIGVDAAGGGADRSVITARDNIYLRELFSENKSTPKDLARKIETFAMLTNSKLSDVGIDAFGFGALVVAEVVGKTNDNVNALLTDKPREGTEAEFVSFRDELAWKLRMWCALGGIIVTNNPQAWLKEFEKIKFKRQNGKLHLMSKVEFKKENGFSPDRFDAAIYTFFKDNPTRPVVIPKPQLEALEMADFIRRAQPQSNEPTTYSSM